MEEELRAAGERVSGAMATVRLACRMAHTARCAEAGWQGAWQGAKNARRSAAGAMGVIARELLWGTPSGLLWTSEDALRWVGAYGLATSYTAYQVWSSRRAQAYAGGRRQSDGPIHQPATRPARDKAKVAHGRAWHRGHVGRGGALYHEAAKMTRAAVWGIIEGASRWMTHTGAWDTAQLLGLMGMMHMVVAGGLLYQIRGGLGVKAQAHIRGRKGRQRAAPGELGQARRQGIDGGRH